MPDLANVAYTNTAAARYATNWLALQVQRSNMDFRTNTVAATPDLAAPTVSLVSPPTIEELAPGSPLVFDVTDNIGLRRVFVGVRLPLRGAEDVVHQGDRFAAGYAASSTRVAISGGWRYSVVRAGGWPENPTLDVYAIDTGGTEA